MNRAQLKEEALNKLKGRWLPFVLSLLAFIAAEIVIICPWFAFIFLEDKLDSPAFTFRFVVEYLLILAFISFVLPLFTMTFIKAIKKAAELPESEPFTFKTFWSGFKGSFCGVGNFWWTWLWLYLWELLCITPLLILIVILSLTGNFDADEHYAIIALLAFILYPLTFGVVINRQLAYSMNWFALAKNREAGVLEAMNFSKKITKGHKGELFVLNLSFLGWYLLCMLTCGLLLLWLAPYYMMTQYNAFNYLLEEYNKSNPQQPEIPAQLSDDPYFAKDIAPAEKPENQE